jgi:glutathione reductase (NADPH)
VPSIHAIGDVTNRMNLTPVALAEGAALAKTLFGGAPTKVTYDNVPTAVFAQPPLSSVGLTESGARAAYAKIDVYTSEFRPLKHALGGSEERTFIKLVVDAGTDRVLGVHVVGIDAPEIVQGLAIALVCGATKAQLDATIGIHPTVAEEIVAMRAKRALPATEGRNVGTE